MKKSWVIAQLLGSSLCKERDIFSDPANIFNLEEDEMVIRTPTQEELEAFESEFPGSSQVFDYDESTPFKKDVFFMQDDFFVDVHDHADPPLHPHEDLIQDSVEDQLLSDAEKLLQK